MTQQYFSKMTQAGINFINTQIATGTSQLFSDGWYIAVGTGNLTPTDDTTALINPIFDNTSEDYGGITFGSDILYGHYAEITLPESLNGNVITEAGLFNSDGILITCAKTHLDLTNGGINNGLELSIKQRIYITAVPANITIMYAPQSDLISQDILDTNLNNYQLLSEKAVANGYCPLDANSKVPKVNLPLNLTPICFNSGNVNAQCDADVVDTVATTVIIESTETTQTVQRTVGQVFSQSGNYTFNAPVAGYYLVDVVGGGGHGLQQANAYLVTCHGGGGSGAGFRGEVYLNAGIHSLTVGGAGGTSSLDGVIVATGGGNASMNNVINVSGGAGGTLSIAGGTAVRNVQVSANGNAGNGGYNGIGTVVAGGVSVYAGWGQGGASNGSPIGGVVSYYKVYTETIQTGGTSQTVIPGSSVVNYKIGGVYPVLTGSLATGEQFTITGLNSDDTSILADGTYNKFVGADGSSELLKNNIFRQAQSPACNVGDVFYSYAVEPTQALQWNGTQYVLYDKVPLCWFTVTSGVISAFGTYGYNQNGYNINSKSPLAKPSGVFVDLTFPASGGTITAPHNGYVQLAALAANSLQLYNNSRTGFWDACANCNNNAVCVTVPCCKGDQIQCYYDMTMVRYYRCYADEGAV